jgi:hypothetical protein
MKIVYSLYAQIQPVEAFCLVGYTGTRGEAENAIKRFFELYSGSSFVPSFEIRDEYFSEDYANYLLDVKC